MKTHDITQLESKIAAVRGGVNEHAAATEYLGGLSNLIHSPGWTTVAEHLLVGNLVETILLETKNLVQLHATLAKASQLISRGE
jgi:hypothetical protein